MSACFVGIDVAKSELVVATTLSQTTRTVANTPAGHAGLVAHLRPLAPAGIVVEATSTYHLGAALALHEAGLPVAIVNPAQTHAYGRAVGTRAKTDAHDARALARYAAQVQPASRRIPTAAERRLADLQTWRDGLTDMLVAAKNRAGSLATDVAVAAQARLVAALETERRTVDAEIEALLAADAELAERRARLRTMPGLGGQLSAELVVRLPELGELDRRAIAALAGVAPHPHDSGSHRGQRQCQGGRRRVTRALYLVALGGVRHNAVIRAHYHRLVGRGKPAKVALIACARKILGYLTVMLREGLDWQDLRVVQRHAAASDQPIAA